MSGLKGGAIITVGNGVTVIDRIQTGGPGNVNIPTEKINELGNYQSVATVRDTPDLSFNYTSLDVSCETEALLSGQYAGRSVDDGVTTASSTTLTSASAAFTSADVGRMVIVGGAGTDGAELVTTIASVTDGTTAVLADAAVTAGTDLDVRITTNGFDLSKTTPIDIASQFKAGKDADSPYAVIASVAVPFLYLSQMQYQFGLHDNASQQGTLNGDTIFYNPGPTYVETATGTNTASQTVVTSHPAYQAAQGDNRRVLAVTVGGSRLTFGSDYTESYGSVTGGAAVTTITLADAVPTSETIRIIYSSPDALSYDQSVHEGVSVKPAAVKGRDIEIYLGGYDPNDRPGSQSNRLSGIQSINLGWQVTLDKDEEFGNYYAVGQDFDVPTVNGSLDFKPRNASDLMSHLRQAAGLSDATQSIGTATSVPLALDIVVKSPDTGVTVKRFHLDDARLTIPGFTGQVQQKSVLTFSFDSDSGDLLMFER